MILLPVAFIWSWISFLVVGLVAGWLAGQITKGRGFGLVGNLIVGVVGAMLGGLIMSIFDFGSGNLLGQIIVATGGAVLLLFLLQRFGGRT